MSRWCVRRWRRAREPNRTKTQEDGSPVRTVSADSLCRFSLHDFLSVYNVLARWNALSSAFAALEPLRLNMPAPRRLPLTTWEKNLVTRLLTPTFSYLARSKSAACQSGEEGTLFSTHLLFFLLFAVFDL